MTKFILALITLFSYCYMILPSNLNAQTTNFKQLSLDTFEQENYPLAISYMHKALEIDKTDKEIYYYLGYYIHYNAYDSRPLKGYDLNYSDTVLYYFDKALEIDPNYGDAKYFYTAECGANAFYSLQQKDYENFINYYKKAYDIGGFPKWSLEYGRLLLNQVEENGILFTHGDFQLNVCWYLQFCEGFRKDISVIPLTMLNRPFFVQEIKNSEFFTPVKIGISDEQIMNMHPFKWKETIVDILISEELLNKYNLDSTTLYWTVSPDLIGTRNLLSSERAFLIEIIESNKWERPIYWTLGMDEHYLGGLEAFGSYKGMVYQLLPFATKDSDYESDLSALQTLVQSKNFVKYNTILETNQERISGIVTYSYSSSILELAKLYFKYDQQEKISDLIKVYINNFKIGLNSESEEYYLEYLEYLEKMQ